MTGAAEVTVLLSTFNAGEMLDPQLRSLGAQKGVSVRLVARDDGSSDGTGERLAAQGYVREALVLGGAHMGVWRSYLHLLAQCPEAEYVAFCDQDDRWDDGKLARAVTLLRASGEGPALYCGRLRYGDAALEPLGLSPRPRRPLALGNALVENVALGPTIVMNRTGRELLASRSPESVVMHDAWAYLVLSAIGRVIYDDRAMMTYRLHPDNEVGLSPGHLDKWWRRLDRSGFGYLDHQRRQGLELLRLFGERLDHEKGQLVEAFVGARGPWAGLRSAWQRHGVYRQSGLDDVVLRLVLSMYVTRSTLAARRVPDWSRQ